MKTLKHNLLALSFAYAFLAAHPAAAEDNPYEMGFPTSHDATPVGEAWAGSAEMLGGALGTIKASDMTDTSELRGTQWSKEPNDVAARVATHEIASADPAAAALLKERALAESPPVGESEAEVNARRDALAKKAQALEEIDYKIGQRTDALMADMDAGKKLPTLLQKAVDAEKKTKLDAKLLRGVSYVLIGEGAVRGYNALTAKDPGYNAAINSSHAAVSSPKRSPAVDPVSMKAAQTYMNSEE